MHTVYDKTFEWENFHGWAQNTLFTGKLLRLCTKCTIHWKTFAVHQAVAIMYCMQQVIQGENFRDQLKSHKKPRKFSHSKVLLYTVLWDVPCIVLLK